MSDQQDEAHEAGWRFADDVDGDGTRGSDEGYSPDPHSAGTRRKLPPRPRREET